MVFQTYHLKFIIFGWIDIFKEKQSKILRIHINKKLIEKFFFYL